MTINAGKLPLEHWLLNEKVCGGRIIGEFCHFVDLALTLLSHTKLTSIECINRDKYYQDTVDFCEKYDQGSFDPNYQSLPLEHFEPMLRRIFSRKPYSN